MAFSFFSRDVSILVDRSVVFIRYDLPDDIRKLYQTTIYLGRQAIDRAQNNLFLFVADYLSNTWSLFHKPPFPRLGVTMGSDFHSNKHSGTVGNVSFFGQSNPSEAFSCFRDTIFSCQSCDRVIVHRFRINIWTPQLFAVIFSLYPAGHDYLQVTNRLLAKKPAGLFVTDNA